MTARPLVYGHAWLHDCLAFADALTAAEEADEIVAIAKARTWREAASIKTKHVWNPVAPEDGEDLEDSVDDPDAPLDIFQAAAVADGDWPPMVTSRALELLPEEILQQFGDIVPTTLNGDYADIPLDAESQVRDALQGLGYTLTRDDNLINVLDGRTFNEAGSHVAVWPVS